MFASLEETEWRNAPQPNYFCNFDIPKNFLRILGIIFSQRAKKIS